jgi:hypothetical protein
MFFGARQLQRPTLAIFHVNVLIQLRQVCDAVFDIFVINSFVSCPTEKIADRKYYASR